MAQKKLHLVCNAHLDPVWLWNLDEGIGETLTTFETAARLCEEFDTFVFNHNEQLLYEWIRRYNPALFKRIQKLVKQGKWEIMGGWYLQPDCNMPAGESFVRQILTGRQFFKKHFNRSPKTAINFDPFGHTQGLVQILAKSGFEAYLFGRPLLAQVKLPADTFVWQGLDGSEILACRFEFPYCTDLGKAGKALTDFLDTHRDRPLSILLWGVGNHGGGPSRKDIRDINAIIERTEDTRIVHSTPDDYFKDVQRSGRDLPTVSRDLNPWGPGCYTSMIRIKQKHRQLENALFTTEKMTSAAALQGLMPYPKARLDAAWEKLLLMQFHDILPGSSTPTVEDHCLDTLGAGLDAARQIQTDAFFALTGGQKKAAPDTYPILIYNPHPVAVDQDVECELNLATRVAKRFSDMKIFSGRAELPTQIEQEQSSLPLDWRKKVVFRATLKPGMNRFDGVSIPLDRAPAAPRTGKSNTLTFRNDRLTVAINRRTGLIDRYLIDGKPILARNAFAPIVIADSPNSWGSEDVAYPTQIGAFEPMSETDNADFCGLPGPIETTRIIEDGPVRTVVETLLGYRQSRLCQRYILSKHETQMQVVTFVHWNEKDKMLKLSIPLVRQNDYRYLGQTAYGTCPLPTDGTEAVSQKFTMAVSDSADLAAAVINDGIYGSDFSGSRMRLTLLRSPAYAHHTNTFDDPHIRTNRYIPRQEQGLRVFRFRLHAGPQGAIRNTVDTQALIENETPCALCYFPNGEGKKSVPAAVLNRQSVQITAVKQAENGRDYILRLFEPTGTSQKITLSIPALRKTVRLSLSPFEIKTLRVTPRTRTIVETDLLETPIHR